MDPEVGHHHDGEDVDGVVAVPRVVQTDDGPVDGSYVESPDCSGDEPGKLEEEIEGHQKHHNVVHARRKLKKYSQFHLIAISKEL